MAALNNGEIGLTAATRKMLGRAETNDNLAQEQRIRNSMQSAKLITEQVGSCAPRNKRKHVCYPHVYGERKNKVPYL